MACALCDDADFFELQVEELEAQLQNVQDELRTEKTLSKINQEAAADEVARAREEIKVWVSQALLECGGG